MNNLFHSKTLISIFALALTSMISHAAKVEEAVVHQIPADSIQKIDLNNVNGSIKCVGIDTDTIELTCTMKVKAGSEETAQTYLDKIVIDIENEGDTLSVKTKLPKSGKGFWRWVSGSNVNASVDYILNVPQEMAVSLASVNGGVTVTDLAGDIDLETVNGGIKARGISGSANVDTVNGGINVAFTEDLVMDDMTFQTVNGGVKVALPESAAFNVKVSTVNGGINCDFPLPSDATKKRRHLNANINGGGPALRVETVNGGVSINTI